MPNARSCPNDTPRTATPLTVIQTSMLPPCGSASLNNESAKQTGDAGCGSAADKCCKDNQTASDPKTPCLLPADNFGLFSLSDDMLMHMFVFSLHITICAVYVEVKAVLIFSNICLHMLDVVSRHVTCGQCRWFICVFVYNNSAANQAGATRLGIEVGLGQVLCFGLKSQK